MVLMFIKTYLYYNWSIFFKSIAYVQYIPPPPTAPSILAPYLIHHGTSSCGPPPPCDEPGNIFEKKFCMFESFCIWNEHLKKKELEGYPVVQITAIATLQFFTNWNFYSTNHEKWLIITLPFEQIVFYCAITWQILYQSNLF